VTNALLVSAASRVTGTASRLMESTRPRGSGKLGKLRVDDVLDLPYVFGDSRFAGTPIASSRTSKL
jgi:hypothetical protein